LKSLFVGETEHLCSCPFAGTNVFSAEHMCSAVWVPVDTKKLNCFIMSYIWMICLVWGQPLKIIRKYSAKKSPAP
jgi:hypothetical protein